jgi:hypothetical protein
VSDDEHQHRLPRSSKQQPNDEADRFVAAYHRGIQTFRDVCRCSSFALPKWLLPVICLIHPRHSSRCLSCGRPECCSRASARPSRHLRS